ncbi:MAG TPA: M48 family metallopeptidase [Solirubrobacteraceae bacterium]|nr:M48 family metallopeptidase [Solirubrobacteraceae bacterium]
MGLPVEGYRLTDISPRAYEHPADRAATAALASVPMLDQVVRKLIEFGYERALRQAYLGASVRLGPDQLPDVWNVYQQVLVTLDMPDEYDLYITQQPVANAMAIGSEKPIIVMNSGLVNLLDTEELRAVLAHEVAHILSDHVLYRTGLEILLRLTVGRLPLLAGLPLMAVRMALLEWSRAAELSCDRAAALVTRDPLVVCRTLMRLTGGSASEGLNLEAYLRQASEYREGGKGFDRLQRLWLELGVTHALPVKRVHEVMEWVRGGEFDRIVGGDYPRRGDPVHVREEADAAVNFYRERFATTFRDAGENLANASDSLADWLRGQGKGDDSAPPPPPDDDPPPP